MRIHRSFPGGNYAIKAWSIYLPRALRPRSDNKAIVALGILFSDKKKGKSTACITQCMSAMHALPVQICSKNVDVSTLH